MRVCAQRRRKPRRSGGMERRARNAPGRLNPALRIPCEMPITKLGGITTMQINNLSSATDASGSATTGSSQLTAMQKQLRALTQQLKDLAINTSLDAKAKQQESQLLQAQIGVVQAQIAAMQNQQQMVQVTKQNAAAAGQASENQSKPKAGGVVTADQVDVYV
jgi:hypothetical protein